MPTRLTRPWLLGLGVMLTATLTTMAIWSPQALLIFPGLGVLWTILRFRWGGAAFFTLGAFFVFQTSEGISTPKVAFFLGVAIAVIRGLIGLRRDFRNPVLRCFLPAVVGAALISFWILLVSLPYSVISRQIPASNWLRDAATYLLISAGVIIGIYAAGSISLRWARIFALAIGCVASVGFASHWIAARGLLAATSTETSSQTLLSSLSAITLGTGLAFALGLSGKGMKPGWLIIGSAFLISVLITGTRTGVVFLLVFVGITGLRKHDRVPVWKTVLVGAFVSIGLVILLPALASLFSSADFIRQRIQSIFNTAQNGISSDQSGAIRSRAYELATDIWSKHPLLGQGLGGTFPDPTTGSASDQFSLDTPMLYLAKFGILGSAILLAGLVLIFIPLLRRSAENPWVLEQTALRGAALVMVAILPFGAVTEDKGFSIVVCLGIVLVAASLRDSRGASTLQEQTRTSTALLLRER